MTLKVQQSFVFGPLADSISLLESSAFRYLAWEFFDFMHGVQNLFERLDKSL